MTNRVKEKLANNELTIGTMVLEFNTPGIAKIIESTGADFALYDMEHTGIGIDSIRQLMSYNRGVDITPIVRVPEAQYSYMAGVLDAGAKGLMIPFVNTKEDAEAVIEATKYYPQGKRGAVFGVAHDDYTFGDVAEKTKRLNDETLIIVQIETVEALENIEEIVATEGVDVAFVGNMDLSHSMGIPGQMDHPRLLEALDKVAEVCKKHGKAAGCVMPHPQASLEMIERGYSFVSLSIDAWLLQYALKKGIQEINENK